MIQVLNRALDILEYLASTPQQPKFLGEIADAVQLNHGTCANILKTMVERRYVDQTGSRKGYCLGTNAFRLTDNPAGYVDVLDAARHDMAVLTRHLDESSLLAVLHGSNRRLIHRELCDQALQVQTPDEKHVYDSASGRLLLAMLTDAELTLFVAHYGLPKPEIWAEAASQHSFMDSINTIRAHECAFQENTRQVIGYGVPIRRFGYVVASLSVYLPVHRHTPAKAADVVDSLRQTAGAINNRLVEMRVNRH